MYLASLILMTVEDDDRIATSRLDEVYCESPNCFTLLVELGSSKVKTL